MTSARETAAGLAIPTLQSRSGPSRRRGRAVVREAFTALHKAWAARTLRRAIADVACTSAEDYRDFGLDKAEILAALERLHVAVERDGPLRATHGGRNRGSPSLAILVTRREPRLPVGVGQSPAP